MPTVTSRDGTTIAFDQTGSGPALILVQGAMNHRRFGLGPVAGLLDPHFTVFHHDRRGRGDSTDSQPHAVAREVDDIAALIEAAGGRAFLFGASSGGALVLEAALAGLPIDGIAVYEVPFPIDAGAREHFATYRRNLQAALANGRRDEAVALFMELVGMPKEAVEHMKGEPFWPALEAMAPTLDYDAALLSDPTLPDLRIRNIRVPTLVLDGGASPPNLRDPAAFLARAIPGAGHKTLPDQTHNVAPEALAPALIDFFGAIGTGARRASA